jgi:hypothetical protein
MKTKSLLFGMTVLLAASLIFMACPPEDTDPGFTAKTDTTTANTVVVLGIVGTAAKSSDETVATVEIKDSKIAITSKAKGTADITVSVPYLSSAKIPVTVSDTGDIAIETIVKGDTISTDSSVTEEADYSTSGLTVNAQKAGTNVLIKVTGAVTTTTAGKYGSGNTAIRPNLYGANDPAALKTVTQSDFAAISLDGILVAAANEATLTNKALTRWYNETPSTLTWVSYADGTYTANFADAVDWLASLLSKADKAAPITIVVNGKTYTIDYSAVVWPTT